MRKLWISLFGIALCVTIFETATGRVRVMCCTGNPPMCTVTEG